MTNNIGKFLNTFASEVAPLAIAHKGVNDLVAIVAEYEVQSAIAAGETLTLVLPDHLDKDYVPVSFKAWSNAAPRVPVVAADLLLTSHDILSGATVLTAANAGVPDDSTVVILYVPCTLGS